MKYISLLSSHYRSFRIAAILMSFFTQTEGAARAERDPLATTASSTTSSGLTFHEKLSGIELTPAAIGDFMASEGSVYFFSF